MTDSLPRVVIIGAGFGGLACAQRLARRPVEVCVIDRHNYHLFTPLLYQVATIGRNSGVVQVGPWSLRGFSGWVAWLVLHLYYLIGFRNRLSVLFGWAWDYIKYDRPLRIITRIKERRDAGGNGPQ